MNKFHGTSYLANYIIGTNFENVLETFTNTTTYVITVNFELCVDLQSHWSSQNTREQRTF